MFSKAKGMARSYFGSGAQKASDPKPALQQGVQKTLLSQKPAKIAQKVPDDADFEPPVDSDIYLPKLGYEEDLSESQVGDSEEESAHARRPRKLFATNMNKEDKLVGVMVTIYQGSSYDENFREIQPTTVPGERVSTWSMACCDVGKLHGYLAGAELLAGEASTWAELLEDINAVPADSVTFNWECCSACGDAGFPADAVVTQRRRRSWRNSARRMFAQVASPTMRLMGLAVRRGFTVMCSDFSLKALLSEWSEEELGPNPFVKLSHECSSDFQLDFIPSDLRNEEVPQQLQVVGELCAAEGRANVAALGGTIMYSVNPTRAPTDLYILKVLTVVGSADGTQEYIPEAMKCRVGPVEGEKSGAAGHVTLTYASGGQLVTSMGHWIELSRLDVSHDAVRDVAYRHFGAEERRQYESEMDGYFSESDKMECAQRWSKQMVQKSVPTRMKQRTKC